MIEKPKPTPTAKANEERWSIPRNWEWTSLEFVGEISTGNTPPTKVESNYGNFIPFVKPPFLNNKIIQPISHGLSKKGMELSRTVPKNSVLVSCIGSLGKTALTNLKVAFNQQINAIFFIEAVIPKFGFYYTQTLKGWLYATASATTLPIVNKGKFKKAPIPIAPFDEQIRIVAEIEKQFSRLDEAITNLKRVKANLKRYKASILKSAVEGKLTKEWRKKNPDVEPAEKLLERVLIERRKKWEEAELAKMTAKEKIPKNNKWKKKYKETSKSKLADLYDIPKNWCWAKTEVLSGFESNAICAGPFGTIFKAKDFRSEGMPIIFLRHVAPGKYLTHKPGFMDKKKWDKLFQPYSVFGGELLITKLGDPPGACTIYPENIGPAMVTPDVIKMTTNPEAADSKYLMHYLNSQTARDFTAALAFGTTRLRLTLPIFRDLPIALPPIEEQKQIVNKIERQLTIIEKLDEVVQLNLKKADYTRQAILKKAFSGKLIPQNPDDEPASILLDRIRQEMEESTVKKARKKKKVKKMPKAKQKLSDILNNIEKPISPEELFQESGYDPSDVDEFYAELKIVDQEIGIVEDKLDNGSIRIQLKESALK